MYKRWKILPHDEMRVHSLHDQLKISPVLCKILVQRGFYTFDSCREYFRPSLQMLHDPWLMKDMNKAVDRVIHAIARNEKILIYGDYDVDGTAAVACMYQFVCSVYDPEMVDFYIPHRYREGYGVSKAGIEHAFNKGYSLIICLDCGIKSADLVDFAATLGINFIICDHHLPDKILPKAVAILNPKQPGCDYPYKELCGCGVGLKLITALAQHLSLPDEHVYRYLDLTATAIAADIVPITGENRVLAFFGMERINNNPCQGIKSLVELSGVKGKLNITNVVFAIAPRVNAAGRMDDARKAVQLFIEPEYEQAKVLAAMLHSDNTDRKDADSTITEEALALIASDGAAVGKKSSVVYREHWHKGVVGIVASRLIEHHYRPTIVLTHSGGLATGSARSVVGYNLYEAIYQCKDYLVAYGGHFAAAGLSMLPENVDAFRDRFEEVVAASIGDELLVPEIVIDSEIRFPQIKQSVYDIIAQMEPFGPENMRPVFISRKVTNTGFSKLVKEVHLRLVLQQDAVILTGIGFNMADKFSLVQSGKPFDVVFTIDENEWNGIKSLQLKVIDLRESE